VDQQATQLSPRSCPGPGACIRGGALQEKRAGGRLGKWTKRCSPWPLRRSWRRLQAGTQSAGTPIAWDSLEMEPPLLAEGLSWLQGAGLQARPPLLQQGHLCALVGGACPRLKQRPQAPPGELSPGLVQWGCGSPSPIPAPLRGRAVLCKDPGSEPAQGGGAALGGPPLQ
jgi:hypothetical protein